MFLGYLECQRILRLKVDLNFYHFILLRPTTLQLLMHFVVALKAMKGHQMK